MIDSSKIPSTRKIKQILSGITDRSKLELTRRDPMPAAMNKLTGIDVTTSHRIGIAWDGKTLTTTSEITVTRDHDGSIERREKYPDSSSLADTASMEAYLTCMIRHRYFPS